VRYQAALHPDRFNSTLVRAVKLVWNPGKNSEKSCEASQTAVFQPLYALHYAAQKTAAGTVPIDAHFRNWTG
jgi:hypothetical protein